MATAAIGTLSMILLFLQRSFIQGFAVTGIKE
jgi:hypothetical protein